MHKVLTPQTDMRGPLQHAFNTGGSMATLGQEAAEINSSLRQLSSVKAGSRTGETTTFPRVTFDFFRRRRERPDSTTIDRVALCVWPQDVESEAVL